MDAAGFATFFKTAGKGNFVIILRAEKGWAFL